MNEQALRVLAVDALTRFDVLLRAGGLSPDDAWERAATEAAQAVTTGTPADRLQHDLQTQLGNVLVRVLARLGAVVSWTEPAAGDALGAFLLAVGEIVDAYEGAVA